MPSALSLLTTALAAGGALVPASAAAGGSAAFSPAVTLAHEIPADVTVRMFVRPAGNTLDVLLRVPLEAMRDLDFPLRGPGYLEIERSGPHLRDAAQLWLLEYLTIRADGDAVELGIESVRVSLPSDRSFGRFEDARAHMDAPPLSPDLDLYWEQALLDVHLAAPIGSAEAEWSVDPRFAHLGLRTLTVLRFLPPDGSERVFQFAGDPGSVRLDPRWHHAALRFVASGFRHILDGLDHLLFLLCLVIPIRRFRPLVPIVTAFTVAHSITLVGSVLGLAPRGLWFPPLIEALIALSIVWMALENILGVRVERRWVMAFGFGLVHGFGFSFALADTLQFAGAHLVTSLFAFNVGVELGQLFVLSFMVPALWVLLRRIPERPGVIVLSALVAHSAWHWMTERGGTFLAYDLAWPAWERGTAVLALRWCILAVLLFAVVWGLNRLYGRWGTSPSGPTVGRPAAPGQRA